MKFKLPSDLKMPSIPAVNNIRDKINQNIDSSPELSSIRSTIQKKTSTVIAKAENSVSTYKEKAIEMAKEKIRETGADKFLSKEALINEVKTKLSEEGIDLNGIDLSEAMKDISISDFMPEIHIPTKEEVVDKVKNFKMPTVDEVKAFAREKINTTKETVEMTKDIMQGDYSKVTEKLAKENDIPMDMSNIESQVEKYMNEGKEQ